jgi:hypothetical protein
MSLWRLMNSIRWLSLTSTILRLDTDADSGVGQRRRRRPQPHPRNLQEKISKPIYFLIRDLVRGPDITRRFKVGQYSLTPNRFLEPDNMTPPSIRWRTPATTTDSNTLTENPLKTLSENLYGISRSGRGSGYHHQFGVAQRRWPQNPTPRPRKPFKTFFHHQFIWYSASACACFTWDTATWCRRSCGSDASSCKWLWCERLRLFEVLRRRSIISCCRETLWTKSLAI